MAIENDTISSKSTGIIPDFFHDIIAYIIPGYMAIIICIVNYLILSKQNFNVIQELNVKDVGVSLVVAYVLGRFFEHIGYMCIHKKKFPFFRKADHVISQKWYLIFDKNDTTYTDVFKDNLIQKIEEWLEKQNSKALLDQCRNHKNDDYFNLIQFYLRERFPDVALYEKKQNSQIILSRSLAVIFFLNALIYFFMAATLANSQDMTTHKIDATWVLLNVIVSFVFYQRFKQDKIYHAMYIFETFVAMKKLLKATS